MAVLRAGTVGQFDCWQQKGISKNVTRIGRNAFSNCVALTGNIVIPEGVTEIEEHTFSGCHSLTSIAIQGNVTRIGRGAFEYCRGLADINIPERRMNIRRS